MRIYRFSEIEQVNRNEFRDRFGGKALGLFEAFQLGILIPDVWLFGVENFAAFIDSYPYQEPNAFLELAESWIRHQISQELKELPNTIYVVRSSAQSEDSVGTSFAGIFESKLNVSKNQLPRAIAEVWLSCFSQRVNSYVKNPKEIKMGVLIQSMIMGKFSGIAFSRNPSPTTIYENKEMVIEFSHESGEKIVQGEVTPHRLLGTVDQILRATDLPWIPYLLKAILVLKEVLAYEIDVEFVIDVKNQFWLVQQRPVSKVFASHRLDLSFYERKYKRSLLTLDVESLIEGCALFLPGYLEIPFHIEHWMVMTTDQENIQELWTHKILEQAVLNHLIEKIHEEKSFLERIRGKYQFYQELIMHYDYSHFYHSNIPLQHRFNQFYHFLLPVTAHYYVPMFMIESIHRILIKEMLKIDEEHCESDLFFLGTFAIQSLMEVLGDQLKKISDLYKKLPQQFQALKKGDQEKLERLTNIYGFLKCREIDEEGFHPEDLFLLMHELKENQQGKSPEKKGEYEALLDKYFKNEKMAHLFSVFREWMRIRNQDMEFLYYAFFKSRPLFEEISRKCGFSIKEVWNESSQDILQFLLNPQKKNIQRVDHKNLVIFRHQGKTRLSDSLEIQRAGHEKEGIIKGKTIYGKGKAVYEVKIAFRPSQLKDFIPSKPSVLLTGMTTPDFVPYLREHFKALITDEGGILCHAAIVAREIPIACIVGTGIATESLEDGDCVQIDFDRGEISCI